MIARRGHTSLGARRAWWLIVATSLAGSGCIADIDVCDSSNETCVVGSVDDPSIDDPSIDNASGDEPLEQEDVGEAEPDDERACAGIDVHIPIEDLALDDALAPRSLMTEDGDFIITRDEWLAVHDYVESAAQLPSDEVQLRERLSLRSSESIEPFLPIVDAHTGLKIHALSWQDDVFPMTMRLAEDLLEYAVEAEISYPLAQQLIQRIIDDPCDTLALASLTEEIRYLSELSWIYHERAEESEVALATFATAMKQDNGHLEGLLDEYRRSHHASTTRYSALQLSIADEQTLLRKLESDYQHYVTVAATTPTYAWIWPFGTIAAASTAAIYGQKAANTKRSIDRTKARIGDLTHEATKIERLITLLAEAAQTVEASDERISLALPTVERARGHWDSLSGDLDALNDLLQQSPSTAIPQLKYLQIDLALSEWREVARLAQGFVENASP